MNNKLNKSINAISDGLIDGGCKYVTNLPGFNSHIIFDKLGGKDISLNEKVAFQKAFGASLAGKRSATLMKGTGLNVALDEYLHGVLNGVNAGLVLVLTDDLEGESSPEIQDSRSVIDMYGGLWFEPYSNQNGYDLARSSFEISESLDIPIVIRLTNNYFRNNDGYQRKNIVNSLENRTSVENRREKYISHWKTRYENLKIKNINIQNFVNGMYYFKKQTYESVIMGSSNLNVNTINKSLLLFTYPLPNSLLRNVKTGKEIKVFENGNNYVGLKLVEMLGSKNSYIKNVKYNFLRNKTLWKKWTGDEKLFKALKKINPNYVVADEGTYTDESTSTTDVCLCMGSAVGITMGLVENGVEYPFCITGDTAFSFGNIHSLMEAQKNGNKFCVIVINNGGSFSTGGQKVNYDFSKFNLFESQIVDYRKTSISKFVNILSEIKSKNKLTVLYVNK